MSQIEDGSGTGKKARVGPTNRLDVSSKMNRRIYYVSRDNEKAFVVNWPLLQRVGGVTEGLGYLRYTGKGHLHINSITLSTEEPGTGLTKFGLWVGSTASGGTERIPSNLNLGSVIPSESDCYADEDGAGSIVSISLGTSAQTVRLGGPSSFLVDFDDALILGKNNVFAIKASAATTGTKTRATIKFYED